MKAIISGLLMISFVSLKAQELEVGDPMPDITLGQIVNNSTGATRFNELKGKLVILDFWDTYCTSCIEGFPRMEKLQHQFGDKIQVILVNRRETKEEVEQRQKERGFHIPNLPSIVNAKELAGLFPYKYSGFTAWINPAGTICVKGNSNNNHSRKVQQALDGQVVKFIGLNDEYIDGGISYASKKQPREAAQYSAFFPFDYDYGPSGTAIIKKVDFAKGTTRNTYINENLLLLTMYAYRHELQQWRSKLLHTGRHFLAPLVFFELLVRDTLDYSTSLVDEARKDLLRTDENWIRSSVCYEQVMPMHVTEQEDRKYMQESIRQYLLTHHKATISVQKRKISCYQLVAADPAKPLQLVLKNTPPKKEQDQWRQIHGDSTTWTLPQILPSAVFEQTMVYDATGYSGAVDFWFPLHEQLNTLPKLRQALQKIGLDVKPVEMEIDKIVIEEKN